MNKWLQANNKLLFIQETLLSKLYIRDFFIKHVTREIYENVGQVLSVVRIQLAVLDLSNKKETDSDINSPGRLVEQSIRELRVMCKSFYRDEDILKEDGFIEVLKGAAEIIFQHSDFTTATEGEKKELQPELKLIVFKMLLQVLVAIKDAEGELTGQVIHYGKNEVKYIVSYRGKIIKPDEQMADNNTNSGLTLQQKAQLIKTKYSVTKSKSGIIRIKLVSPLKCVFYE